MAQLKSQLKQAGFTMLEYGVTFVNFYLSTIFFIVLVIDETMHGKPNHALKERMLEFIDRVIEIPEIAKAFLTKENLQRRFNFHNIFE